MLRRFLAALAALSMAFASPLSAATLAATPATFAAVRDAAKPGDTIVLGAGQYLALSISGKTYAPPLKIDATAAGVVVTGGRIVIGTTPRDVAGLTLDRVVGLEVSGGTFRNGCAAGGSCSIPALDITNSQGINIASFGGLGPEVTVAGQAYVIADGYGIRVNGSSDVTVTSPTFTSFKTAFTAGNSSRITLTDVLCERARSDCINMGSVWDVKIDGVRCFGTMILSTEHPDCVQFFSRANLPPTARIDVRNVWSTGRSDGVLFSDKLARVYPKGTKMADGSVLAVDTTLPDGGFQDVTLANIHVATTFVNGLSLVNCVRCTVRDSDVVTLPGAPYVARYNIQGGSVTACGLSYATYNKSVGVTLPPCADKPAADESAVLTALRAQLAAAETKVTDLSSALATAQAFGAAQADKVMSLSADLGKAQGEAATLAAMVDGISAILAKR